jgi:hypothetical protein
VKQSSRCLATRLAVLLGPVSGESRAAEPTGDPRTAAFLPRPLPRMPGPEALARRRTTREDVGSSGDALSPMVHRLRALDDVVEIIRVGNEAAILYPVELPF